MIYIAKINWIKPENGGRKSPIPFNTDRYAPRIVLDQNIGNWSLVVNNFTFLDNFVTLAEINYLNRDNAPNNLYVGCKFELYEGAKKVATGLITDIKDENS